MRTSRFFSATLVTALVVSSSCVEHLPPGSWHFASVDGSAGISVDADPTHQWSGNISMVSFLDEPHIFGADLHSGDLLQAWKTSDGWQVETLDDGSAGALTGPVVAFGGSTMRVFAAVAATSTQDMIRVRSYDPAVGWLAETVPLSITPRTPVRMQVEALTRAGDSKTVGVIAQLKLQYAGGEPEHALFLLSRAAATASGGWSGRWITTFSDPAAAIPQASTRAITGFHPTQILDGAGSQLFFGDAPSGDLIQVDSSVSPAVTRVIDGDAVGDHTSEDVSQGATAVLGSDGYAQVFYRSRQSGLLRHAWENKSGWHAEVLDGNGGGERTPDEILPSIATALIDGQPHAWYAARPRGSVGGSLVVRHAWWDVTRWRYETFDGAGGSAGQRTSPVPMKDPSVVVIHGSPFVSFGAGDTGALRVAEWR